MMAAGCFCLLVVVAQVEETKEKLRIVKKEIVTAKDFQDNVFLTRWAGRQAGLLHHGSQVGRHCDDVCVLIITLGVVVGDGGGG